jgi:hypothetical protein
LCFDAKYIDSFYIFIMDSAMNTERVDIKDEISTPTIWVSPWLNSTIEPDTNIKRICDPSPDNIAGLHDLGYEIANTTAARHAVLDIASEKYGKLKTIRYLNLLCNFLRDSQTKEILALDMEYLKSKIDDSMDQQEKFNNDPKPDINFLPQENSKEDWFEVDTEKTNHNHLINLKKHIGVNTIGSSLGRGNYDLRGDVPHLKLLVSPWSNGPEPDSKPI